MSERIFAIRPEPGLSATIAAGRAAGLEIEGCPLFDIRPVAWEAPPPDEIDALLIGSANAVRHGGPDLAQYHGKPAFAVGKTTAQVLKAAGFPIAAVGKGGLQPMLDALAGRSLRLLRLSGVEHLPVAEPQGITLVTRIVYDAIALPMPPELAAALASGGVTLLHSGAAASHFAAEYDRAGLDRSAMKLAALGPRIAHAAGSGWREVRSAAAPREAAILALALDMCH